MEVIGWDEGLVCQDFCEVPIVVLVLFLSLLMCGIVVHGVDVLFFLLFYLFPLLFCLFFGPSVTLVSYGVSSPLYSIILVCISSVQYVTKKSLHAISYDQRELRHTWGYRSTSINMRTWDGFG